MNKKQLAIFLSKLEVFTEPDMDKEQYPTDSEIAADIIWHAHMRSGIANKIVADLGSGTGILGIGALIIGAKKVYFVDSDPVVFEILERNLQRFEKELGESVRHQIKFITKDIEELSPNDFEEKLDVVIQNPPFGTKLEHADRAFLDAAMRLAPHVYSFHKSSTMDFILSRLAESGYSVEMILKYEFPIKKTMEHHHKKIERIDVFCVDARKIQRN